MGRVLLFAIHTVFSLALVATARAATRSSSSRALRVTAIGVAFLPLALIHVLVAVHLCQLRFEFGIEYAPWILGLGLVAAHVCGSVALLVRDRDWDWPLSRCALTAIAAFAADATTWHVLTLDARLLGMSMQLDSGRIAYALAPATPEPERNAAPLYVALQPAIDQLASDDAADEWLAPKDWSAPIDTSSRELRELLARTESTLDALRRAAQFERCVFERRNELDVSGIPNGLLMVRLERLLALSARVRAADGDIEGASTDIAASFSLASHVAQTPSVITLMITSVVRDDAVVVLTDVLNARGLHAATLEKLSVRGESLEPKLDAALRMEEAFALGAVGMALASSELSVGSAFGSELSEFNDDYLGVVLAREEAQGLRDAFAEMRAKLDADESAQFELVRRHGLLARLVIPNLSGRVAALRSSDAKLELARAAIAAKRFELEHGEFPRELGEGRGANAPLRLARDGDELVLTHTGKFDKPLELRLSGAK